MKINRFLAIIAISGILLTGCGKDDSTSDNTPTLSKTQLLTGHSWKMTATYFDGVSLPIDTCDMDNIYTWATDGTYTEDAGAVKCDPNDPQILETTTWTFNYNQTKVIMYAGTPDEDSATILLLDANSLRYRYEVNDSLFGAVNVDVHFIKR